MGKRKSGGGDAKGAPKALKNDAKQDDATGVKLPVDAMLKEQVQRFDRWLSFGSILHVMAFVLHVTLR